MTAYDIYTIGTAEYKRAFWDKAMRGGQAPREIMQSGNSLHDTLILPADSNRKFQEALRRERRLHPYFTCTSDTIRCILRN